jgi:hypothetical protein
MAIGNARYRAATLSHTLLVQGPGPAATNWDTNMNSPLTSVMGTIVNQSGTGVFTFGQTCLLPANPTP